MALPGEFTDGVGQEVCVFLASLNGQVASVLLEAFFGEAGVFSSRHCLALRLVA